MIERILVPVDGTPEAEAVLGCVAELAERLGAEVCFVQVVDAVPPTVPVEPTIGAVVDPTIVTQQMEAQVDEAEAYLTALSTRWREQGLPSRWFVLRGEPAAALVDFVGANEVDLVAMATHGRTGLGRLVFGSVADSVVHDAGVPVLLVRGSQTEPEAST